jgi:hypothetical protein
MKILTALILILSLNVLIAEAQLRKDLTYQPEEYTGAITHTQSSSTGSWMNLLNMTMSHSYSMSFTNFGGQTYNMNAYTNSMFFDVSDRLDAQLDISLLHSPFGNSFLNNSDNLGTQIIIDSARLDYRLSENTRISLEFSQNPYRYGYGNHSPFNRRSIWY